MKNITFTLALIVTLLIPCFSKAQSSCATSTTLLSDNYPLDVNINKIVKTGDEINWYKIPVYKDSIDLQLVLSLDSFAFKAYKIEVFSGNCTNLTLLKVDSLINNSDTILNIGLGNLIPNDSLYLKITNTINNYCNPCVFKNSKYALIIGNEDNIQLTCICAPSTTSCDLVCNGNFEQFTPFNSAGSNIDGACGWDDLTNGTSDYYSGSLPSGTFVSVPCNWAGVENAHSGQGYAGFGGAGTNTLSGHPNGYAEYVKTRLVTPLLQGQQYTLSFWLSFAELSRLRANTIGAFFYDNLSAVNTNISSPISVTPQLIFNVSNQTSNGWTQYTATYTPTSPNIQYLAIGAFTSSYTVVPCGATLPSCSIDTCGWWSYYFIDDVSLTGPLISNQTTIQSCPGNSVTLTSTLPQPLHWANSNWVVTPQTTQSISVSSPSTYYAFSTNNPLGCKNVEVFNVSNTLSPNQSIALTPYNPTVCLGDQISITASGLTPNQYNWYTTPFFNYNPTSPSINNTPTYSFTPTATTTLYIGGNAANGCRNFSQTTITVVNPPQAIINTNELTMCENMNFDGTYTAQTQAEGTTYSWSVNLNGLPYTTYFVTPNNQSIHVDWGPVFNGNYDAQVCLTVSNGSCSRSTCIDVKHCCQAPAQQYIFASAQPNYFNGIHNNETVIVSGTFNATANAQFVDCNITFTEGSKIIENTNDLLTFINCHLYACTGMWKGIEMMPSCSLRVADCLVEDAETFARANTNCGIDFFNNFINRCIIGVDLTNFNNGYAIIKGDIFSCRENVPFHFPTGLNSNYIQYLNSLPPAFLRNNSVGLNNNNISQYGIITKNLNTNQLYIMRGNFNLTHLPTFFDNLETGIYAENSGFKIDGAQYNKCGDNGTAQNYVQNNRAGLVINKSPKYSNIPLMEVGDNSIYNENYFVDCLNGIYCTGSENINILKNKFERIIKTGIYLETGTDLYTANIKNNKFIDSKNNGIHFYLSNNVKANIFENRFEGAGTTSNINARAILLQEFSLSNSSTYTVYNNYLTEFKTSIIAENISNSSSINDNEITMKNDNTPFDFQFGIRLVNSNGTRVVNNKIFASVSTNEPVRWWQYGIYNSYSPNTYISCNFISGPDVSLTCQGPTPLTIVNNTFKNPNFAGYWLHSNGISGPQGNSTTPSDNKWQYANNIVNAYHPLKTYTSLNTNGVSSPFYYRNISQYIPNSNGFDVSAGQFSTPIPTGTPYVMDSNLPATQCSYIPTPTYRANINNNMAQKTIKEQLNINTNSVKTYYHARKALYNTLVLDSIGAVNDTVISNFKTNAANYNMGKLLEADVLINQGLIADNNLVLDQAELTNSIVSVESIEQNQKEVNDIFIRYAKANFNFNHADKQRLKQLAALCPETEGTAVYQARTLVSKFDNTAYYNECELIDPLNSQSNSSRLFKQAESIEIINSEITIYPNPAENELFINTLELKGQDVINVLIYSSIGKLIKSVTYSGQANYRLDLSDINAGTYFYKILVNNSTLKTDKLIIIK